MVSITKEGTFYKQLLAVVFLFGCTQPGLAQECWIQPGKFTYDPMESLQAAFRIGDNFIGGPSGLEQENISRLELKQLNSSKNLLGPGHTVVKENMTFPLTREGTHLLVMQTNSSTIEWEGEAFEAYLNENGLDEIKDLRNRTNSLNKPARDSYTRYAKLLFQVSGQTDNTYKLEAGFPLEIIPERNPYSLQKGDPIRFTILFQGNPLFGIKVRVWNRFNNRTTIQNIYTEKNGMMETHLSNPGPWMVSVVKMEPSSSADAEWQSYRSTLVFGVE